MTTIVVSTHAGDVTVSNREEAEKMILATGMTWMCTPEELASNSAIQRVANSFGIDLTRIERTDTDDEERASFGFPYDYKFV